MLKDCVSSGAKDQINNNKNPINESKTIVFPKLFILNAGIGASLTDAKS